MTLKCFLQCFHREGVLDVRATFFNASAVRASITSDSEDPVWVNATARVFAGCLENAAPELTPRQMAVYTFTCIRWSLFAVCDRQQDQRNSLDAEGALRRTRFLSENCPLSPSSLRGVLELVTGRTPEECSRRLHASNYAHEQYEFQIVCIASLFRNVISADGTVDLQGLKSAIPYGQPGAEELLFVVNTCLNARRIVSPGYYSRLTPREFVNCWADWGVLNCLYQEANQVATRIPNSCDVIASRG